MHPIYYVRILKVIPRFYNNEGIFYNRGAKQSLVSTSSTHAKMRAIFTLVKDILYIFYICSELQLQLTLPAIIMEDNSAVINHSYHWRISQCKEMQAFSYAYQLCTWTSWPWYYQHIKDSWSKYMSDVLTKPNFNEKDFWDKDRRPPWKASSGSLIVYLYISTT